jgi:hypothetical protein
MMTPITTALTSVTTATVVMDLKNAQGGNVVAADRGCSLRGI